LKHFEPERIRRLLVRGTNWVGDAVMSIPALREIRRKFRNARISLLVRPWVKDVYTAVDFVDEILIYDKPGRHQSWEGMRRLAVELRSGKFELTVLFQNAMEAALIAFWARIPIRIGYARDGRGLLLTHPIRIDPDVKRFHQAYYYLGLLSGAGLIPERPWQRADYHMESIAIDVLPSDLNAARQLLQSHGIRPGDRIIGINPGASFGSAKRWPSDRFAAVADALSIQYGANIVIFGAPSEAEVAREVGAKMTTKPVTLAGCTTLGQLMGLIRECKLFITNDSGPMHLAAALNVPQLAIFGSTSEIATGPLSNHAQVIKNQVDCNPCFLRECPIDFRCMLGVSVADVIKAAREKLGENMTGERVLS
jgi:heptosyltransferase II